MYSLGIIDDYGKNLFNTQIAKTQSALFANDFDTAYKSFNGIDLDKITGGMNPNNI